MSRFTSHLGLELAEDAKGLPIPTMDGRAQWDVLPPPLAYEVGAEGSGETITINAGVRTDLGSIPQIAWSLGFSPDGIGAKAFVLHDAGYLSKGTYELNGFRGRTRATAYSRSEVDALLREALAVEGVGVVRRNLIYAAVRVGGARGWGH